jgi:hypothetical protein
VAKALGATNTNVDTFVQLIIATDRTVVRTLPIIGLTQAAGTDSFDGAGFPVGKTWSEVAFPATADESAWAIKVAGNESSRPIETAPC